MVSNVFISLMARVSHRLPVCVCVCLCASPASSRGERSAPKRAPGSSTPLLRKPWDEGSCLLWLWGCPERGDWWLVGGFNTAQQPSQEGKGMLNDFWITQDGKSLLLTFYKSQGVLIRAGWGRCFLPLRMEGAKMSQG